MKFDAQFLKDQLPYYLTAEGQTALLRELEKIVSGGATEFILSKATDEFKDQVLQGDGWRGLDIFEFNSNSKRTIRGMVLSNSCDVSQENERVIPSRIMFSPLVKLNNYKEILRQNGIDNARLDAKIDAIKSQLTTSMFYIPAGSHLSDDYVVRLDDIHSIPTNISINNSSTQKLFTLCMPGFYMLILKLSIHFCRLQENINRGFV